MKENQLYLEFPSIPSNESLARLIVAAFASALDPTIEEISDIKSAVTEAVTNCIIHGYPNYVGTIIMRLEIQDQTLYIEIIDEGVGIQDLHQAMQPLYTSRPDLERAGMGFSFMEAFMDNLKVTSELGKGTAVYMSKKVENNY